MPLSEEPPPLLCFHTLYAVRRNRMGEGRTMDLACAKMF